MRRGKGWFEEGRRGKGVGADVERGKEILDSMSMSTLMFCSILSIIA